MVGLAPAAAHDRHDVIDGIASGIGPKTILGGSLPHVACMFIEIILCFFAGIASWLPDAVMGPQT